MRIRHLQTRFVLGEGLLLVATLAIGAWSALMFARLSSVVDNTLGESQETIDLSAELATSLEREDDALLLALSGAVERAQQDLVRERRRGDGCYEKLMERLAGGEAEEQDIAAPLRQDMDDYRRAGSVLLADAGHADALERYHKRVNPLLRQAVATCGRLREVNFRSMEQAGVRARDEARRATWIVTGVSVVAVAVAALVAVWLARSVVGPVRELTVSVEALREGHFDRHVPYVSGDELGELAGGFNRMAEALAEYRSSSLGDLLAAKTTLEATLNALPNPVMVIAPDGGFAAMNPPAKAVVEATSPAGAPRVRDLPLSEEQRGAVQAALAGQRSVLKQPDFQKTFNVILASQTRRFLLSAVPIPEFAARRMGAVLVLDDVTEFARLDELRSELIGVASHELKSPLTTLRMNLLMLGEGAADLTARQQQYLTAAAQGCEELASTIEELLDVTRIEAGQLRLNLTPVDLESVLATARRGLQARFDDSGVTVHVVRDAPSAVIQGDAARLGSVFTNLLTNALKYSRSGSTVEVKITPELNAASNGTLRVSVTDQGCGIPEELRERVFEKFFRVEHHSTREEGGVRGTGIGLYLCREIVKAHGGTIRCDSGEDGSGTRITISFPVGL